MPNEILLDFMAKACNYAQEHCSCPDAWGTDDEHRVQSLQCTSYQIACFLAQNTVEGINGVGSDVILDDLIDATLNEDGFMVKSELEWKVLLRGIAIELGGWK